MRNADAGQAIIEGMPKTNPWDFLVLPFHPIRWYLRDDIVRQVSGICHDVIKNHKLRQGDPRLQSWEELPIHILSIK